MASAFFAWKVVCYVGYHVHCELFWKHLFLKMFILTFIIVFVNLLVFVDRTEHLLLKGIFLNLFSFNLIIYNLLLILVCLFPVCIVGSTGSLA